MGWLCVFYVLFVNRGLEWVWCVSVMFVFGVEKMKFLLYCCVCCLVVCWVRCFVGLVFVWMVIVFILFFKRVFFRWGGCFMCCFDFGVYELVEMCWVYVLYFIFGLKFFVVDYLFFWGLLCDLMLEDELYIEWLFVYVSWLFGL